MERKSKHDMQGKVGKYKGTFQKKSSLSRVEKMIEGTRKYHLNRQMNDTNEYEDPMDLNVAGFCWQHLEISTNFLFFFVS